MCHAPSSIYAPEDFKNEARVNGGLDPPILRGKKKRMIKSGNN
jgi:hypothetical protein